VGREAANGVVVAHHLGDFQDSLGFAGAWLSGDGHFYRNHVQAGKMRTGV
jgi:hypothetical protein